MCIVRDKKVSKNIRRKIYDTVKKMSLIIMVIALSFTGISVGDMEIIGEKVMAATTPKYGTSGKWAYHILQDSKNKKTVEIALKSQAKKLDKKLTIPSTLKINKKTYTVTKIADSGFYECYCDDCLKKEKTTLAKAFGSDEYEGGHNAECNEVVIPTTIETIGEFAFYEVYTVTFKDKSKLKTIGECAFGSTSIKKITIPASVEKIEDDAFDSCQELNSITFEKGSKLKTIGECAFYETSIKNITIPKSVTTIKDEAFAYCNLSSITFETEKSIKLGDNVFVLNPISKVYVENYDVYNIVQNNLINMDPEGYYYYLYEEDYTDGDSIKPIYFYSAKTRLIINGKYMGDVAVGKNYNKTINLNNYLPKSKTGQHLEGVVCDRLLGIYYDGTQGYYKLTDSSSSADESKIISYGYPYMDVKAKYAENEYSIMSTGFEVIKDRSPSYKNGDIITYKVKYNDQFTVNPYPTDKKFQRTGFYIDGYVFKGDDQEKIVKASDKASRLTAIHDSTVVVSLAYKPIKYDIVYDGNNARVDIDNEKCEYNKITKITTEIPERKGYKFLGWSEDKSGNDKIYKSGQQVKNLTTVNGDKVTLYAIWEKGLINMYFDANGGVVSQNSMKVAYESTIGIKLPEPEREGYNFVGWTMGKNGGTKVDSSYYVNLMQDFTIYAQWEEQEYEITFDANGGETNISKKKVLFEESIGVLPKPTRDGYKFEGWYTTRDGGNKVSSSTIVQKKVTYYAHWIQKTKQIKVKIKPPNGRKVSGYQIRYSKNGVEVFNETKPATLMNYISLTINGAKDGDVYEIKARYYVMKKGKKKWSKETVKRVNITKTGN